VACRAVSPTVARQLCEVDAVGLAVQEVVATMICPARLNRITHILVQACYDAWPGLELSPSSPDHSHRPVRHGKTMCSRALGVCGKVRLACPVEMQVAALMLARARASDSGRQCLEHRHLNGDSGPIQVPVLKALPDACLAALR
jgi:hypothetical protein